MTKKTVSLELKVADSYHGAVDSEDSLNAYLINLCCL
jgi:hypothetical protein